MYLAAVREREEAGAPDIVRAEPASARWQHFGYSRLSHHGQACCETAREWLLAMDFAQLNGGDVSGGPRWLGKRYEWGPSAWPMHWCEAVSRKVVDCGVHAALAQEAFVARGVRSFRAQFIQRYSAEAVAEWRRKWQDEKVSDEWTGEEVIYHEGNALLVGDDEVKLWDPSAGCWINPRQFGGYGSVVAVRIFSDGAPVPEDGFRWGGRRIKAGQWCPISA